MSTTTVKQHQSRLNPPQRSKRRGILVAIGAVIVLLAGTAEISNWWLQRRAAQQEADRAAQIAADAAKSKDYLTARSLFKNGHFDPGVVANAVQGEFEHQAATRVNGYFLIKTQAERTAYLDKVIDEMNAFARAQAIMRMASPTTAPSNRAAWKAKTIAWATSQPPDARARIAEFSVALGNRRVERGLPRIGDGPGN